MAMTDPINKSVCVGISVYKQPLHWLQLAVASVQEQTHTNWKLCIRTDGVEAVEPEALLWLERLVQQESKIRCMVGGSRLGCFGSYREIFKDCDADFIVQLDADDELVPSALDIGVTALFNHPEAPYLYSQCELIDADSKVIGHDQRATKPWSMEAELVQFIPFHMRMVRHCAYQEVGGYNQVFQYTGDYDLSLKLSEVGSPLCLKESLYRYRLHRDSASQQKRLATHQEAVLASRAALRRRNLSDQYALLHCNRHERVSLHPRNSSPVVVAGMHRSGTSLLSRLLVELGVSLGSDFVNADRDNPDGYLEERDLVTFHSTYYLTDLKDSINGWPDWGWEPSRTISPLGRHEWRAAAEALMQKRKANRGEKYWGWKDPRSTLVLPFWREINQGLQVLGIYRSPWDLSDALQRIGHPEFRQNPHKILPLWTTYNRRLVEYKLAYPDEMVLLHAQRLSSDPDSLVELLKDRWEFKVTDLPESTSLNSLVRSTRLQTTPLNDPIERLYWITYPEVMQTWQELQEEADWPAMATSATQRSRYLFAGEEAKQPIVTVIIPTYNPSHLLLEAIASVERYRSSEESVELLIIDDGTNKPESLRLLGRLEEEDYTIIHQSNQGLAAARNTGFSHAKASLIIPLDDDNRLLSPYLREIAPFMQRNPHVDVGFGDRLDFGAIHQHFQPGAMNRAQMISSNRIDACAVIRKDLWERTGGYDTALKALEDWDFWLTAGRLGIQSLYAAVPCFEYRVREGSMLRDHLQNKPEHQSTMDYLRSKHGLPLSNLTPS